MDDRFEQFWNLYPKKLDKGHARKAFDKLPIETQDLILQVLPTYRFSTNPQYIPYPATWLNGERWLDEPLTQHNSSMGFSRWEPSEKDIEFRKKHGLPEL